MAGVSIVAVQCSYIRSGSHEPSGGSYVPVHMYITTSLI